VIESAKNRDDASRLAKLNVSTKERVFIQYVKILKVKRVSTDSAEK
jgi:hypothetical protein